MSYDLNIKELEDAILNGLNEKFLEIDQKVRKAFNRGESVFIVRDGQNDELSFERFPILSKYDSYIEMIKGSKIWKR
jgi:hypothetical protein